MRQLHHSIQWRNRAFVLAPRRASERWSDPYGRGTGVEGQDGNLLHPLQQGFLETLGFQCGFCTPGFLMTLYEFLNENRSPSEDEIRERLSGNLCRCTGYQNIVAAVLWAAERLRKSSDR